MPIIPVKAIQLLARRTSEDARQYAYRVLSFCILEFILFPKQKLNEVSLAESLEVSRTRYTTPFSGSSGKITLSSIPNGAPSSPP